MRHEHEDEPALDNFEAPAEEAVRSTPVWDGRSLAHFAARSAGNPQAQILALQRSAGNASVARTIRASADSRMLSPRRPRTPTGTVTDEAGNSQAIPGSVITPGPETDPEVLREQRIARAVPQVTQQARLRLLEARSQVTSATESFRDYATGQIDGMDDAPSGYWGLVGTGVGLIGGVITAAFPAGGAALAIGVAIATAIQGAVQTQATEEATDELERRKADAKRAMTHLATKTRDGFDAAVGDLTGSGTGGRLHRAAYDLSIVDDEARMHLESGQEDDLNAMCDRIGVPAPRRDIFDRILTGLNQQFGEWKATQEFNQEHSRFWQMVAEADPRSEVGQERRRMLEEGRAAGGAAAREAIEARRRAQGRLP